MGQSKNFGRKYNQFVQDHEYISESENEDEDEGFNNLIEPMILEPLNSSLPNTFDDTNNTSNDIFFISIGPVNGHSCYGVCPLQCEQV